MYIYHLIPGEVGVEMEVEVGVGVNEAVVVAAADYR